MNLKNALRRILFFPLEPRLMRQYLAVLRFVEYLPKRVEGQWPPKAVLVLSLTNYVGDTLMTIPTLDALHRQLPHSRMDVVAEPAMDKLLRALPYIQHVYSFTPSTTKIPALRQYFRVLSMLQFAHQELKQNTYDLAVVPRTGEDPGMSVYLAAMSSAARRCGHDPNASSLGIRAIPGMKTMLTAIAETGVGMPEGVRQQLVLQACGLGNNFDLKQEEFRVVGGVVAIAGTVDLESCLNRLQIPSDQPMILLAPGASHPSRRWPTERFAALAKSLQPESKAMFYSIGGRGDKQLGSELEQQSGGIVKNICGATTIPETLALVARAALLVTNDSGPAHMGGSLGTPTVVLSACPKTSLTEHASSPSRVRPVGPRVVVLQPDDSAPGCNERCSAEAAHCICGVEVSEVLDAAKSLLVEGH